MSGRRPFRLSCARGTPRWGSKCTHPLSSTSCWLAPLMSSTSSNRSAHDCQELCCQPDNHCCEQSSLSFRCSYSLVVRGEKHALAVTCTVAEPEVIANMAIHSVTVSSSLCHAWELQGSSPKSCMHSWLVHELCMWSCGSHAKLEVAVNSPATCRCSIPLSKRFLILPQTAAK